MRPNRIATGALTLALCGGAGLALGCGPKLPPLWDEPLNFVGVDVGDRQVFVSPTAQRAVVVDPVRNADGVGLEVSVHQVGEQPGAVAVSSGGESYYVVDEATGVLGIIDVATGERTEVVLDSAFDRIAVDPHGEFLVLSFSGNSDREIIARNLNEVAIVDLRGAPKAAFLTLASRPVALTFAPPFELAGESQRMAVVSSVNEVTVLDLQELDEPDDALREVPLTISEADAVRNPQAIAFDVTPEEDEPDLVRFYVLAAGSNDITEITIQPAVLPDAPRKLDLAVNQLAAGASPHRMLVLELPAGTRLLVADASRPKFTMVDVASGESATFDLPMGAPATGLEVYQTALEADGEVRSETRVLAHSPRTDIVAVIRPETIAVGGEEPTLGRSVEAIRLEHFPAGVRLAEGQPDRAIAFHSGVAAGFTILDLRKNNDVPIQGGTLSDIHFDGTQAFAVFQSLENFTVFGLDGHPTNFDLPAVGVDVFLDGEEDLLLVRHANATGSFTVLDAHEPTPEQARFAEGVFLHQLMDQEIVR